MSAAIGSNNNTPGLFGTAAIGAGPVLGDTSYSGMQPSFPSSDALAKGAFQVVVASWRAVNADTATFNTADFAANVGAYAPRVTPVTRVKLTDVDLPCTQRRIEPEWARVYWGQGVDPNARSLDITLNVGSNGGGGGGRVASASVVLPAPCQAVTTYVKSSPAHTASTPYVTLFFAEAPPYPVAAIVEAWSALAVRAGGVLALAGVQSLEQPFVFDDANTVLDDSRVSFRVFSAELHAALPDDPAEAGALYLYATPVPGPAYLATILSRCVSRAAHGTLLADLGIVPEFTYSPVLDRFTLRARGGGVGLTLSGSLAQYMGFGSPYMPLVVGALPGVPGATPSLNGPGSGAAFHGLPVSANPAPNRRDQGDLAFSVLTPGDPVSGDALAANLAAAMNAFDWGPVVEVTFTTVAAGAVTVAVPGGRMTLQGLVSVFNAAFQTTYSAALSGIVAAVAVEGNNATTRSGIAFRASDADGTLFAVDFTSGNTTPADLATRIGYDAVAYGFTHTLTPTRAARHIPVFGVCVGDTATYQLPRSNVAVTYRSDTAQLVIANTPFPPMGAVVLATPGIDGVVQLQAVVTVDAVVVPYTHGLVPGMVVALGNELHNPVRDCLVIAVPTPTTLEVVFLARSPPGWVQGLTQTLITPFGPGPALDLYFTRTARFAAPPEMLGFPARTLESASGGPLASPGSVAWCQDAYVILCLGFDGADAEPNTGDVYYPFPQPAIQGPLVFAKVPRVTSLRVDFDKLFDHSFPGSGYNLGYIRVRVLNPDGTLYATHGHRVSVTLRFECRESYLEWGGGHVAVGPITEQMVPAGNGRGSIIAGPLRVPPSQQQQQQ